MTSAGNERRGFQCDNCGSTRHGVYYTRQLADGVARVRICLACGHRIYTRERRAGQPGPARPKPGDPE